MKGKNPEVLEPEPEETHQVSLDNASKYTAENLI